MNSTPDLEGHYSRLGAGNSELRGTEPKICSGLPVRCEVDIQSVLWTVHLLKSLQSAITLSEKLLGHRVFVLSVLQIASGFLFWPTGMNLTGYKPKS
ncbi:hypothetical protein BO94DRAFT_210854 [Aspergillus sclerotioniger CBS 115572]|uniref:Uncharacterized protein n=1 Tax=Aspergillus sclerotioniger CBS 115572 TaxID=1450535 RepID=A0A317VQC8_9EURO|nr:hypothetical protein BO94DRAFT_210854 [Aspergillus sclerotioniger CBS 115572]PWY75257.1 hypothetical protein BO94DRAFT_210854 [Aspergillus sclerotioniger CBS 115572]